MAFGFWEIALLAVVALLFFGSGRVAGLMGELGKGLASFKRGLAETTEAAPETPARPSAQAQPRGPVALLAPPTAGGAASAETGRR